MEVDRHLSDCGARGHRRDDRDRSPALSRLRPELVFGERQRYRSGRVYSAMPNGLLR